MVSFENNSQLTLEYVTWAKFYLKIPTIDIKTSRIVLQAIVNSGRVCMGTSLPKI